MAATQATINDFAELVRIEAARELNRKTRIINLQQFYNNAIGGNSGLVSEPPSGSSADVTPSVIQAFMAVIGQERTAIEGNEVALWQIQKDVPG